MQIIWGGTLEEDGKRHGEYQATRRGVSIEQIQQTIQMPDEIVRQSVDCIRYFKHLEGRTLAVVAVQKGHTVFEVITCWWEDL